MIFRIKQTFAPLILAFAGLLSLFAFIPTAQDPGQQTALFTAATITTTTQTAVFACSQGSGSIGRKTLTVHNAGAGVVTVTVELRDDQTTPNFTSGYLAVNNLASGSTSGDTATPAEAGGRYCQASAASASTSTITATLRRE